MLRFRLVTMISGLLLFSPFIQGGRPSRFHDLAQIGDGGGVRTVFLVLNQNPQPATVTIAFFKDDGSPLVVTVGETTASTITASIPAGGTTRLATPGLAPSPQVGWARLTATEDVGAQVLFEISTGGQLITQAAVESSGALDAFDVFVDQTSGTGSGIAIANLSAAGAIRIRLSLKDQNGTTVASRDLTLASLGHLAQFVVELFPQAAGLRGSLHVETSGPVSVVALQQTGLVLGTLPVVQLFF